MWKLAARRETSCLARVGERVGGQNQQPGQTRSLTASAALLDFHRSALLISLCITSFQSCGNDCCTPPMRVVTATTGDDGMGWDAVNVERLRSASLSI